MALVIARPAAQPRSVASAVRLAWLASLTFFAGFYALLVPLPRYLAALGFADWQIGLVLGTFGVAALVGRPLAGVAVDRRGARPTMLVGAAALAIGAAGVVATASLGLLVLLRVLQAIGYVAFTTASTALVVSLVAPGERAGRLAAFGAAANLAISLTPAAITALLQVAPTQAGLLATTALAAVGGLLALCIPGTPPPADARVRAGWWRIPRRLWRPMLVSALLGAGFAAFFQFAPILAERRSVAPGLLYAAYGGAIIATRLVGSRLLDRFAIGRVVLAAAALMVLGEALLASSGALPPLLLAAGLVAASGGLFHPALIAHHAALLSDAPGRATAAFYMAFDLGIGVGSWLLGIALQLDGVSALYWTAALLALAVVPLAPRLTPGGADAHC